MGAYKGAEARYNIVSTRLTDTEAADLRAFAAQWRLSLADALRMFVLRGCDGASSALE